MRSKKWHTNEIVRRYIVTNSFDGALTILGILLAVFFAGIQDPRYIILPGIGAATAMGVSGIWGAYAAEISEVRNKRRELEKHLLVNIGKSKTAKQRDKMAVVIGVVNGLSSFIVSLLIIIPFFLVSFNIISMTLAYYLALGLIGVTLFLLGMFTGFTAEESVFKKGFVMLLAGIIMGFIFYIMAKVGLL